MENATTHKKNAKGERVLFGNFQQLEKMFFISNLIFHRQGENKLSKFDQIKSDYIQLNFVFASQGIRTKKNRKKTRYVQWNYKI